MRNFRLSLVLLATTTASFLTPFTTSSITLAFPKISAEFNVSLADVNWVSNIFLIALASSVLILGLLSDSIGRNRIFISGIVLFIITSLALYNTYTFREMLIYRSIQGIASAMISATAVAILSEYFPREIRGLAIGINTASVYLGLSLAPLLGGYIVERYGWRALFLFKISIALIACLSAFVSVRSGYRSKEIKIDLPRALLIISATIAMTYGTSVLNTLAGSICFPLGLIAFITIFILETRKPALLNPSLLRRRLIFANLAALLNYSATYAITIALSDYLQSIRGFKPGETGLILSAQPIVQVIISPVTGLLSDRYDPSVIASIGMFIIALGISPLLLLTYNTSIYYLLIVLVVLGLGFALFASPNTTAIMNMSPREAYASATSLLATMRFLGQAISTSIITLSMQSQENLLEAIKISFIIYVMLSFIGAFLSLLARVKERLLPTYS